MNNQSGISERALILPVLLILEKRDGLTPSQITDELIPLLKPEGKDLEIIPNRNDTYFSQKVRNLLGSHKKTNGMNKLVFSTIGHYHLTKQGRHILLDNKENVEELFSGRYALEDVKETLGQILDSETFVFQEDFNSTLIVEGKVVENRTVSRMRSSELRKMAIEYYSNKDGSIKCAICGFDFEKHYGVRGKGYIEIHHEVPLCSYTEDGKEELLKDAINKVKPLCANCHRMIHRDHNNQLSVDELKQIYKK